MGKGWKNWKDWLGSKGVFIQRCSKNWRPFEEAKEYVRTLGIVSQNKWEMWSKSGLRPADIPSNPPLTYREEWVSWDDWFDYTSECRLYYKKKFRPFEDARAFVHTLGLKNAHAWFAYAASGDRPDDIPSNPHRIYCKKWVSFPDWLGYTPIPRGNWHKKNWLPYTDAREIVHRANLKSAAEYRSWRKSNSDIMMPSEPAITYSKDWVDWYDWLGKERL